jgi:hypothetical protein
VSGSPGKKYREKSSCHGHFILCKIYQDSCMFGLSLLNLCPNSLCFYSSMFMAWFVCVWGGGGGWGVGVRYKFQASIPGTFSAYQPSFTQCPGLESVTVLVGARGSPDRAVKGGGGEGGRHFVFRRSMAFSSKKKTLYF